MTKASSDLDITEKSARPSPFMSPMLKILYPSLLFA
eukprot:CAMPEP_0173396590 /NCGR_PEP_ID=MMETSP1356-20130122/35931_1 /TAXON_ID=77927 ORGANISM="Hemiselmis virescens, Strain PCC157" /NCGR_SAMPLE_ID=MMETSP1356 /ASSEMBLY_ACC=CAM_ASM_000847 /LENGTH=35 /DNA_ID= /DNA_START= /DNA_END= /DNA_ORIENTATION=